jgi:DNA-binding transcriptional LysR family regulator
MLKLESIAAFAAVAETGSITAAARRLGVSKSVISERLTELERMLGTKLMRRTTRALSLTDDGQTFLERSQEIMRKVQHATSEIAERGGSLTGSLRVSAPVSFGILHLGPALFGFISQNPGVELNLDLDDRFVDIMGDGYDAVVRHGPINDSRVIVKRLSESKRLLVASREYLKRNGEPSELEDLAKHRGIIYGLRGASDWRFRAGRKFVNVRPRVVLRVNNGLLMRDAAVAGIGIAMLPAFLIQAEIKQRTLKILDVRAEPEGATLHIAYPEHLRSSAKIRSLTNWLSESFGKSSASERLQ